MDHPCWRCGESIERGDLYCANCGAAQVRKPVVVNPATIPDVPNRTLRRIEAHKAPPEQNPKASSAAGGIVTLVVLIAVVIGGVFIYRGGGFKESRHEITGSVTLHDDDLVLYDSDVSPTGSGCAGNGGFSNISGQASVTVYDGNQNVVGSSRLDFGYAMSQTTCRFEFVVSDVRDADFYEIRVAGRGGPTYTKADFERTGWSADLSIGDQS